MNCIKIKRHKLSFSHCKLLLAVSLSVFEISFSFLLEFSLYSSLVLSLKFFELSVSRASSFSNTVVCLVSEAVLTSLLWIRCCLLGIFFILTQNRPWYCQVCHLLLEVLPPSELLQKWSLNYYAIEGSEIITPMTFLNKIPDNA